MMEPMHRSQATLVDLLDRILDRGVVINADIVISLAGIPLIGLNLRAALAGIATFEKYGALPQANGSWAWEGIGMDGAAHRD